MEDTESVLEDKVFCVPAFPGSCRVAAHEAWQASFEHPFVRALVEGSLPAEKFRFYQMQDARYLEAFADACSIVATRCVRPEDKIWFVEAARVALVVESELHAGYGQKLGYTPEDVASLDLTPDNRAYRNHMIAEAGSSTLVEAVAALTPCPWLYIDLGRHFQKTFGAPPDGHPYADWLRTYADPAFVDFVNELLERLQRFAEASDEAARVRARENFAISVRYEWMFWQQAWIMQTWPV